MKRIIVIIGILFFSFVAGCTEKEEEPVEENIVNHQSESENEIKQLKVDSEKIHAIAGWLSNDEILYVENNKETYLLKAFHITKGESYVLFEDQAIMTNVLIHPSKDYLLIHTSTDETAATIKIITRDGVVQNEVTIESTELEIAWNDINPERLLLTAFYEDWSYDTFYFDASTDILQVHSIENPFPKWFGEKHLVTSNPEDQNLVVYDIDSQKNSVIESNGVVHFDAFQNVLLTLHEDGEEVRYRLMNTSYEILAEAFTHRLTLPISIQTQWIDETKLLFLQSEMADSYELMMFDESGLQMLTEEVDYATFLCAPNGEKCLTGMYFETIFDLHKKEEEKWLVYDEETMEDVQ